MNRRPLAIAALIIASVSLPACGLTGDLKRPAPLWGQPDGGEEAKLPEGDSSTLPKLPPREEAKDSEADDSGDELLGGPED